MVLHTCGAMMRARRPVKGRHFFVLVDVGTCQWLAIVVGTNAHKIMCGAWRARKTQVAKYCSFVFFPVEQRENGKALPWRPPFSSRSVFHPSV
jgi:hypothetical protein